MESALRPRDIQARIRAGETPEAVAAAQTTVEKIMTFAGPVLAERAHVAAAGAARLGAPPQRRGLAGAAAPRRRRGRAAARPQRRPGDRRVGRLAARGRALEPDRRYSAGARKGRAAFSFDAPGRYVVAEDDEARWLVGEAVPRPKAAPSPAPTSRLRAAQRRLSAVPDDELPLGEDAIEHGVERRRRCRRRAHRGPRPRPCAARGHRASRQARRPRRRPSAAPSRQRGRRRRAGAEAEAAPSRTGRRPAAEPRSREAGPRCRAGTRSCSAAASATSLGRTRRSRLPSVVRHVLLRHRRHRLHRPAPRPRARSTTARARSSCWSARARRPGCETLLAGWGRTRRVVPVVGDLTKRPSASTAAWVASTRRRSTTSSTSRRSTT